MWMNIYRYIGNCYGDGIVLVNPDTINENNYNLYHKSYEWEFIGQGSFALEILEKLDNEKTLVTFGFIDLSYID